MGQALYRKYRSKSLSEIVGQEHITDTLTKALASGRISHAYLFSGPRGVGKTSIARILAHEINGLAYTDDSMHLDIIEIDAASNRRIDEIRDLRDKVYIAPTSGAYKVYIIDEVHMLTREAFNALLKTLEEPPAHAVFILATTEAHKLPETIVSRTQHYTFKTVDAAKVIEHLRHIATTENVAIDDEALAILAAHGEGSFRDSISVLDQAQSLSNLNDQTEIRAADVRQLLGIVPDEAIDELIIALSHATPSGELLGKLSDLYAQGLQAANIASQLAGKLRTALTVSKPLLPVGQSLSLMKSLIEVPASHNPERLLEIVLLESADTVHGSSPPMPLVTPAHAHSTAEPVRAAEQQAVATPVAPQPTSAASASIDSSMPDPVQQPAPMAANETQPTPAKAAKTPKATVTTEVPPTPQSADTEAATPSAVILLDAAAWPNVLGSIKKEYNTLYGVLRMANPVFTADGVELQFKFLFHQKRLNEVKNKKIIAAYIKQITGSDAIVTCTYVKDGVSGGVTAATDTTPSGNDMEAIQNIFGSAEVLDS
ncbi:MAG TPA: DNA polymerase III subunit gamma/tau [Candidatus Saccharimonadales bacterium]|jgi:DNA polymerase-3 subunit gamma/tau